ncbi:hypothetical protein M0811_04268 [Anaeramoeba ignava]|uniref:TLDc domain-containing protein n=1 Tax=Anaeramoeba ignava TaxID=1746090 RepID=A0A9Q0LUG2_ANAIG|nr:hypothetical protein M0811_04268 [Anaeramoeba ignava]
MKKGFSAKRDGFNSKNWHNAVDGKGKTLVIIKTKDNFIFGGFTQVGFKYSQNGEYINDSNAFIFSLRNDKGDRKPEKFTIKKGEEKYAILSNLDFGPFFGSDIWLDSELQYGYSNFGYSYNLPNGIKYKSYESRSYLAGSLSIYRITISEPFGYPLIDRIYEWQGEHKATAISKTALIFHQFAKEIGDGNINRIVFEEHDSNNLQENLPTVSPTRSNHPFQYRRCITPNVYRNVPQKKKLSMVTNSNSDIIVIIFHSEKTVSNESVHQFSDTITNAFCSKYEKTLEKLKSTFQAIADEKNPLKTLDEVYVKEFASFQSSLDSLKSDFDQEFINDNL